MGCTAVWETSSLCPYKLISNRHVLPALNQSSHQPISIQAALSFAHMGAERQHTCIHTYTYLQTYMHTYFSKNNFSKPGVPTAGQSYGDNVTKNAVIILCGGITSKQLLLKYLYLLK